MKKLILVLLVLLLCCTASCEKEKKNEKDTTSITLRVKQIEENYFLAESKDSPEVTYKVYTSLESDYCVGDDVIVTYQDKKEVEKDQLELSGINITEYVKSPVDFDNVKVKKPVIYLYPEKKTKISVQLDFHGELTQTIPNYEDGWKVIAYPDGTLINQDGNEYPYLFWEGEGDINFDLSQGFCISGEDTELFLKEKLFILGLNEKESEEFIDYWLPYMEKNPYNIISFPTIEYTDNAKLTVNPEPDCVIRIFMVYQPSDNFVEMEEQPLLEKGRTGFVLIEWGGCEISK